MFNLDWAQAKDVILEFFAGGIAMWLIHELHEMRKSIDQLNLQIAVVLEKNSRLERDFEKLEERVQRIDAKLKSV